MKRTYVVHVWKWEDKMELKETPCERMNRIHLAQNKNQWWALVKTVMNFYIHKMLKI
jgi:hypothetical protein